MAVVVFGDEYMGESFEYVLDNVDTIKNRNRIGEQSLRIHAVGFDNPMAFKPESFSVLMRELTARNDGAFIALENTHGPKVSSFLKELMTR